MATLELPPSNQKIPGSFGLPKIDFPQQTETAQVTDPKQVAVQWAAAFTKLLAAGQTDLSTVLLEDSWWRDLLCLTWNFHTLHGPSDVAQLVTKTHDRWRIREIEVDDSTEFKRPKEATIDVLGNIKCVQSFIHVKTDVGRGTGLVRLLPSGAGTWKAYTLFTTLNELEGFEEMNHTRRPRGVEHVSRADRNNWQDEREREQRLDDGDPTVLVIGCGQAGLTVAARLKQLNIRTLVIDRFANVGDNWRKRYHHLVLHDSVWFDHMPYLDFPPQWPVFTPKDKLAGWFEFYAKAMELTIWTHTTVQKTDWDDSKKLWEIRLERNLDGISNTTTIHPRHVILATGASGKAQMPDIPGIASFEGDRLIHSSSFKGFPEGHSGAGKKVVIVGSGNSAHDIAQDYSEHHYEVTMSQRGSTLVVGAQTLVDVTMAGLYCDGGPPVADADIINHSFPWPVLARFQVDATAKCTALDDTLLRGLQEAGFQLDAGPNLAGLWTKYLSRGGGYYIDTGCSALISSGAIALKPSAVTAVGEHSVHFADGTELPVDEVVFATGYGNMQESAAEIFGEEVAERAGPVWGFDEEGETRGLWRKGGCEGFWYMGGNLALCRFYSRSVALVIKALEEGLCSWDEP